MQIALLYNGAAGDGVSGEALRRALEQGGHRILRTFDDAARLTSLREPVDAVVVAGGDGTVAQAAHALLGRDLPLAILPLGTANNIAASLGMDRPLSDLIAGWHGARRRRVDVGIARGDWGERIFVEAVGAGLVPWGMAAVDCETPPPDEDAPAKLERALRKYRHVLAGLRPRQWAMTLDGARTSGSFLLVEVLNTGTVGPNLVLSDDADPSDGVFSIVTAGEEQRDALDGYLEHRLAGRVCPLALPTCHARRVEIHGAGDAHVDGELHAATSRPISLRIRAAALDVLH